VREIKTEREFETEEEFTRIQIQVRCVNMLIRNSKLVYVKVVRFNTTHSVLKMTD
jgi:hypothetical protein